MAQLDVYRISARQYAIDCQSEQLEHLATRFVVPLLRPEDVPEHMSPLHPTFEVAGQMMVMATHLAGALPVRRLREPIASLAVHSYAIQRALDTLISGV